MMEGHRMSSKESGDERFPAFIEAARELGWGENFGRYDDALRRIGMARLKADSAETTEEKDRREGKRSAPQRRWAAPSDPPCSDLRHRRSAGNRRRGAGAI
jgi:hypothetical protein